MKIKISKEKKNDKSIRNKTIMNYVGICIIVIALLFLILGFTGYFSNNNEKMQALFNVQLKNVDVALGEQMNEIEAKAIGMSDEISKTLNEFMISNSKSFEDLNDDEKLIEEMELKVSRILNNNLNATKSTGAFMVFDVTCNTESDGSDRASVYLRRSDVNGNSLIDKNVYLFRGIPSVGRKEKFPIHNRWDLEFDTDYLKEYDTIINGKVDRLGESCIWSVPINLKDTWEKVSLLCMPVIDRSDNIIGVCGFELSEIYFHHCYPDLDDKFMNMVTSLVVIKDDTVILDKSMMDNTIDNLKVEDDILTIITEKYYNRYKGENVSLIGKHKILPYKMDGDYKFAISVLVDGEYFRHVTFISDIGKVILLLIFIVIIASVLLLWLNHFIAPWSKLVETIRSGEDIDRENIVDPRIKELITYFDNKQHNVVISELPENVEEMLSEFVDKVEKLTPMERTVLHYYIEDYNLNEIADTLFISLNTAKKHNTNINRKLDISNRDELLVYIDIFRRCNRIDQIEWNVE